MNLYKALRSKSYRHIWLLLFLFTAFIGIVSLISFLPLALQLLVLSLPLLVFIFGIILTHYQNLPVYLLFILVPLDTFISRVLMVNGVTEYGTLIKDALVFTILAEIFVLVTWQLLKKHYEIHFQDIDIAFILLILVFFVGTLYSPYIPAALFDLRGLIWFGIVYLFMRWQFTIEAANRLFRLNIIMSAVVAAYGIAQLLIGEKAFLFLGYQYGDVAFRTTGGFFRAISTTDSAGTLAAYTMMWIAVLIGVFIYSPRRKRKWLLLLIGILVINMFFTTIRGAWIGLAVGLISGWLVNKRFQRWTIPSIVLFVLIISGINVVSDGFLMQRVLSSVNAGTHTQSLDANKGRLENLAQKLNLAFHSPVLGQGLGTTGIPSIKYKNNLPDGYVGVDNFYVKMLFEIGILGLGAYLLFYFFILRRSYKIYFKVSKSYKGVILGTFMAFISLGTMNLFHSILESPLINLMFWFFIALNVVISQNASNSRFGALEGGFS